MIAGFLLTAGVSGVSDSAEAASGTWKHNKNGYWYEYSDGTCSKNQWLQIGKKWYHFDAKGFMKTGWLKIGGKWYYFGLKTGAMQTGWKTIGGKTYYFKTDGSMAANEYCKGYWLNKDGSWTTKAKASWKKNVKGWWFGSESGWYAKNQWLTYSSVMGSIAITSFPVVFDIYIIPKTKEKSESASLGHSSK